MASVCGAAGSSTGSSKSSGTIDVERSEIEMVIVVRPARHLFKKRLILPNEELVEPKGLFLEPRKR